MKKKIFYVVAVLVLAVTAYAQSISTDVINELTAAAGVTVDGMLVKDGYIQSGTLVSCDTIDTNGSGKFVCGSDSTGTGEANTGSNVGVAGVGVFKQKTGVNLEFRNVNAGSSKISITNDAANNEIDVDVAQANLTLSSIGGSVTDSQVPNGITIDLAATATALAANGANCSAGNYPLGVDASGASETCTADDDTPDSDSEVPNAITVDGGLVQNTDIILENASGSSPTVDGDLEYNRTTERLEVGDGATTTVFYSGAHTVDTNGSTICAGTTTYLDGEGNCDDISSVYEPFGLTANVVTSSKILDNTITSSDILNATITSADMATSSIVSDAILNGTIATTDLADDSVTSAKIITSAVSADELDEAGVEAGLEAVLDLQDLQGAVTDGQVPNTITVDLAATATALAANPTDCAASQFATTIAASGNLTCSAETDPEVATLTSGNFCKGTGTTVSCTDSSTYLTAEVDGSTTNELQDLFKTIDTSSGTDPVADSNTDTLTLTAGTNMSVSGNSTTDTITIASTVTSVDSLEPLTDDTVLLADGITFNNAAVPSCADTGGNHLNYSTASNAFSCGTSTPGAAGDITSVIAGSGLSGGATSGDATLDIATGGVTSSHILNATIVSADIASNTIASSNILNDTIDSVDILNGTIITADLADDSVTSAKIVADTIVAGDIATDAVTTTEILDSTVASADIAADTIVAADIATGGVASAEILDDSVASADILNGTIDTTDIAGSAVTSAKILGDTIISGDIANNTIDSVDILNATIIVDDLADGAVTSAKILDSTIDTADIAADTIIAGDIATSAVATAEILDSTVASIDIAADTIVAADVATGGIATAEILDATILPADLGFTLNFTTSEADTLFTWTDGKTIYKKTISTGALPNTTTTTDAHGISGATAFIGVTGWATNGSAWIPIPYVSTTTTSVQVYVDGTNINLVTISNLSSYTVSHITLYYIK